MWKCKKCGGKIRVTLSRIVNTDYNIDENYDTVGKCLKKTEGEIEAENFYCSKCGEILDNYKFRLEDIAEWVEK